jgi:hypothetical protein
MPNLQRGNRVGWACTVELSGSPRCVARVPSENSKATSDQTSFLDIFEGLMRRLDAEELDLVASTARQIWLRRNQWVFEEKFSAPYHVYQRAAEQLEAAKTHASGTRSNNKYVPPLAHEFRIRGRCRHWAS